MTWFEMTYWSYSASPGASPSHPLPPTNAPAPHFSKALGVSWLLSGPQSYIVCTCSLDIPVRNFWSCPVFDPTSFAPGWAPWMSHGPHAPFTVPGSGPALTPNLLFLTSSQPSLLPGTVRRQSKDLNAYVAGILFLGGDPRYWKRSKPI